MLQKISSFAGLCLVLMFPAMAGSPETRAAADSSEKAIASCGVSLQIVASTVRAIDRNGNARYEYVGDERGNLCRYELPRDSSKTSAAPSRGKHIFTAKDANGKPQPIVQQPHVVFAPGGYLVLFGTGKFSEESDALPANFSTQSFYAIYDQVNVQHEAISRVGLEQRELKKTDDTFNIAGESNGKFLKGWYIDFPNSGATGERSVTSPLVADGLLVFHTLIPGADFYDGTTGHTYILNVLTGLPVGGNAASFLYGTGVKDCPVLEKVSSEVISKDGLGRWTLRTKYAIKGAASGETGKPAGEWEVAGPVAQAGRLSWREILPPKGDK